MSNSSLPVTNKQSNLENSISSADQELPNHRRLSDKSILANHPKNQEDRNDLIKNDIKQSNNGINGEDHLKQESFPENKVKDVDENQNTNTLDDSKNIT